MSEQPESLKKLSPEEEEFKRHLDVVGEKFRQHVKLESDDEVIVLKSHLVVEYYLNHILLLFSTLNKKEIEKLTFAEKVQAVENIPTVKRILEPHVLSSIRALNKIRNELGHQLEFRLTESQVDSIGFCEGQTYILRKFDGNTRSPKEEFMRVLPRLVMELYRPIAYRVADEKGLFQSTVSK